MILNHAYTKVGYKNRGNAINLTQFLMLRGFAECLEIMARNKYICT